MKKILFAIACLLMAVGCQQNGQNSTTAQTGDTLSQEENNLLDMERIYREVKLDFDSEVEPFTRYARLQVFGYPAILFGQDDGPSEVLFVNLPECPYFIAASHQGPGHIEFYENGLKQVESCGSGCSNTEYIEFADNHFFGMLINNMVVDSNGKVTEQNVELMGYDDTLSEEEGRQAVADAEIILGQRVNIELHWQPLE